MIVGLGSLRRGWGRQGARGLAGGRRWQERRLRRRGGAVQITPNEGEGDDDNDDGGDSGGDGGDGGDR